MNPRSGRRRSKLPGYLRLRFGLPRTLRRLRQHRSTVAPLPHVILLRWTERCPHRCSTCGLWGPTGAGPRRVAEPELPLPEWRELVDRLPDPAPLIHFWGGEPLLRASELIQLVAHCTRRGVPTSLFTSGYRLAEFAEDLVAAGLDGVYISLEGDEEHQDRRRSPGSFQAVEQGLRALTAARRRWPLRRPRIQVNATVAPGGEEQVIQAARLARRMGADRFSVQLGIFCDAQAARETSDILARELGRPWPGWNGFVRDPTGIDPALVQASLERARKMWGRQFRQYPPLTLGATPDVHFHRPREVHGGVSCLAPWVRAQVSPAGRLVICEDVPDLEVGDLRQEPLRQIWNGPLLRSFRRVLLDRGVLPACTRCCGLYELQPG